MITKQDIHRGWLLCMAIAFLLLPFSCAKEELEIKQNFDYEVTMQKYRTDVEVNKPVDLVFFIKNAGKYEGVQYSVNYFLRQGSGQLYDRKNQLLGDNTPYRVQGDTLQIRYTPTSQGDHTIEVEFSDNFGLRKEINVKLRAD